MISPNRSSLLSLFVDLYEPRKLVDASKSCRSQYKGNLRAFSRHLGHDAMPADLTDENVMAFIRALKDRGLSPATCNKIRAQLVALWNFLARKRIVEQYPDVPQLREPTRIPIAWTSDQLAKLFGELRALPGHVDCIPAADWWLALHGVLWDTGLRIGAAIQLEWGHVDLDSGIIVAPAEIQKQGADQRFCLGADTLAWLRAIVEPKRKLVFPWPRCESSLWGHYGRILKKAGLPNDRRSKFHRMRRSHASHLKRAGGDPTAALGHSSPRITARYLDPAIVGAENAAAKLPRFS